MQKKCTPVKHFFEYFNERIPQNWNEPAITDFDGDKNYTYGEMATKVAQLQVLLQNAGLERGDKVVICSKNCSNWAISFLSIAANRGVIVSIMDAFMGNDIEKLINHSDAKAVFGEIAYGRRYTLRTCRTSNWCFRQRTLNCSMPARKSRKKHTPKRNNYSVRNTQTVLEKQI